MSKYKVKSREGEVYEVKKTKRATIMLCGEWECLELSFDNYIQSLANGRYSLV